MVYRRGASRGKVRYRRSSRKAPAYRKKRMYRRSSSRRVYGRSRGSLKRTQGLLGVEKKFLDSVRGTWAIQQVDAPADLSNVICRANPGASGVQDVVPLFGGITQGDGANNRDGYKIVLLSIELHGQIRWNGLTTVLSTLDPVDLFVVLDKQPNGSVAALSEVFTTGATGDDYCSTSLVRNMVNAKRFRILWHKRLFRPVGAAGAGPSTAAGTTNGDVIVPSVMKLFKWFKKMKRIIEYTVTDTTGISTSIVRNAIHLYAIVSDENASVKQINYQVRCRFIG